MAVTIPNDGTPVFPDIQIGMGSNKTKNHRILVADFGDGYNQTLPDGLNTSQEEWALSFGAYPIEDINTIDAFLSGLKSSQHFYWVEPYGTEVKKWKQTGPVEIKYDGPMTATLDVTIKRVYNL